MQLEWTMIPGGFALCFASGCPLADDCLRFRAGTLLPPPPASGLAVNAVSPHCQALGAQCPMHLGAAPVRFARGFRHALDALTRQGYRRALSMLLSTFSEGAYYERKNGKTPLTPKEQAYVARVLEECGAPEPVEFDEYEEGFDFGTRFNAVHLG